MKLSFNRLMLGIMFCLMIGTSEALGAGKDTVIAGMDKAAEWMQYAMWAISACGALSVGFMLMFGGNESMIKHVGKWTAVTIIITLSMSAPTWFGLVIKL